MPAVLAPREGLVAITASRPSTAWLLLGALLPIAAFVLDGHVGLGKADEGFLWYGAQRVLAGEVPLRDFQSYDIGRYYWSALWMMLAGSPGIVALRFGDAVLASCAVAIAIALVRERRPAWLLLAAATFTVWMVPEYKVADSFAALLLVAGLAGFIRRCDPRGAAVFGLCLGVAATIGINHGLYGTIGGLLALGVMQWRGQRAFTSRTLVAIVLGVVIGYAPVWFCFITITGFAAAFVDAIRMLVEAGTTNVFLPMPDPLAAARPGAAHIVDAWRESSLGVVFLATPVFLLAGLWTAARRGALPARPNAVFTAAICLGVPYAHYAWSSAGLMHVAVSGLPLVVAMWTLPPTLAPDRQDRLRVVIALFSVFLLINARAGYQALRGRTTDTVTVLHDTLRVPPDVAAEVRLVQRLTTEFAGRRFFAAHDWPGAYAMVGQRAPNWEIYEVFPSRPERQRREIDRLIAADPAFAIVTQERPGDLPDGIEKTHPAILRYVERCFVRRATQTDPPLPVAVFVARGSTCTEP